MSDLCKTLILKEVTIQENGIIRNKEGCIIGNLTENVCFDSKHLKQESKGLDSFKKELQVLINCHSKENESNTPDYVLVQFILSCLKSFNTATQQRETSYGRDSRPTYRTS